MDPIEKLKYIITEWKKFIQKARSYNYHGTIQACYKDWYFTTIKTNYLENLTPPVYAIYNNSLNWNSGWAFVYLYYRNQYRLDNSTGTITFRSYGNLKKYDSLVMGINLKGQNCSIQINISYIEFNMGVYNPNIPTWNYYVWNSWIESTLGNIGMNWEKYGYYTKPYYIDWWCWKKEPDRYNLNYIMNFKYLPEKNKYLQYDNFGRSTEINNNITATITLFNYGMLYESNYPGTAFRYNGISVDSIVFYKDIWE